MCVGQVGPSTEVCGDGLDNVCDGQVDDGCRQFQLSVSKSATGSGSVSSSPAGINCGSTCTHPYSSGTTVALSATAGAHSTFTGWSGACSGTGARSLSIHSGKSVTATFTSSDFDGNDQVDISDIMQVASTLSLTHLSHALFSMTMPFLTTTQSFLFVARQLPCAALWICSTPIHGRQAQKKPAEAAGRDEFHASTNFRRSSFTSSKPCVFHASALRLCNRPVSTTPVYCSMLREWPWPFWP